MASTILFPTNAELREIAQTKIPNLIANRPAFKILPMADMDADLLMWDQMDNYMGLQQIRGLNGAPTRVKRVGAKRFSMQPGVYGEFLTVDELEITRRKPYGAWTGSIRIDDLVMKLQDQLLGRELDRIEKIIWDLVTAGTFSVVGPDGLVLQTDTFTLQTASAAVPWGTTATATPLADFRAVQLLSRGFSVSFGADATAYMNRVDFNKWMANTNALDFGGKKGIGLQSITNLKDTNTILFGEGLPQIVVMDEGYLSEPSAVFVPFIPTGKVVIVGRRLDGAALGNYLMTRNANNPNEAPGAYMKVVDIGAKEDEAPPRQIQVHRGHNGGPVIEFPSAIVILTVV